MVNLFTVTSFCKHYIELDDDNNDELLLQSG